MKNKLFFVLTVLTTLLVIKFANIYADDYYPTDTWRTSTPEAQGMDSDVLYKVIDTIQLHKQPVRSLLVIRHGYLVEEAYFYPYHRSDRQQIQSCTKSFTSALVGIAFQEGFLKDVNQKVVDFFPEINITNLDERKKNITIENLLTMTAGFDWPEQTSGYGNSENPVFKLETSENWAEYVLDKPMKSEPGKEWQYNSGASHLLSAIVHKSSKMDQKDFVERYLFNPLCISNYKWDADPQNNFYGGVFLRIKPLDMAKLGFLYLKKGKWNGKQIIPEDWVAASSKIHYDFQPYYDKYYGGESPDGFAGYGYQFWVYNFGGFGAYGLNGQYVFIFPDQDMVVVFTADFSGDLENIPIKLCQNIILKSVKSDRALPEKEKAYSNHLKILNNLEKKAPKYYIYHPKDSF